jgi:hypothetical protein
MRPAVAGIDDPGHAEHGLVAGINDAGYSDEPSCAMNAKTRVSDWLQRLALQDCSSATGRSLFGFRNRIL